MDPSSPTPPPRRLTAAKVVLFSVLGCSGLVCVAGGAVVAIAFWAGLAESDLSPASRPASPVHSGSGVRFDRPRLAASAPQGTVRLATDRTPAGTPPADVFELVQYQAPLGVNVAYVSPVRAGVKRPAMLWLPGGFDWGINEGLATAGPRENDQSAAAYREAGVVLMIPSLRGSNENPGRNECLLGEVDDVLAAAEFLSRRADVDPARVYLGGHSTGGTMALLAAESSARFRAVFAFGPVGDPRVYGDPDCLAWDAPLAAVLPRSPVVFVDQIVTPTWILEGEFGNADELAQLERHRGHAPVHSVLIPDADHFEALAAGNELIAEQILRDVGPTPAFDLDGSAIASAARRP